MITIIVAYSKNFVIGKDGQIPWHIPEDLKHFKKITGNSPLIMGRVTWESLPVKPLPNRLNVVVSRKLPSLGRVVNSLEHAITFCDLMDGRRNYFIIGGGRIYREALKQNLVDKVIASEVKASYDGDTFFPDLYKLGWKSNLLEEHELFNVVEYTK
jgi:dihydrofolate reductase